MLRLLIKLIILAGTLIDMFRKYNSNNKYVSKKEYMALQLVLVVVVLLYY